jgi:hypothetical protein
MKLKIYDRKVLGRKDGKATMSINDKGMFAFSSKAASAIGFCRGDKLLVIQDVDKPKDWYLAKSSNAYAFEVRGKLASEGGVLCFNSSHTMLKIKESLGVNGSIRFMQFLIGSEPVKVESYELWPIITKSMKTREEPA